MRIKEADDKQPQLDALTSLLDRPDLDADTRRRIEREIKTTRAGIAGERDAAYLIDFEYANRTWAIIHDLRVVVDSRVAQIDHLLVNRLLDIWVLESKHFSEGVSVNEHAEWVTWFGGRPSGIASPIEQNRRHVAVVQDVFDKGLVRLPKRLGAVTIRPRIRSLVLVSNNARIGRPKSKAAAASVDGLATVIKAERLRATIEKDFDTRNPVMVAKVVSEAETERVARDLVALHQPARVDWPARFGFGATTVTGASDRAHASEPKAMSQRGVRICQRCGRTVSPAVVAYCAANPKRLAANFCATTANATIVARGPARSSAHVHGHQRRSQTWRLSLSVRGTADGCDRGTAGRPGDGAHLHRGSESGNTIPNEPGHSVGAARGPSRVRDSRMDALYRRVRSEVSPTRRNIRRLVDLLATVGLAPVIETNVWWTPTARLGDLATEDRSQQVGLRDLATILRPLVVIVHGAAARREAQRMFDIELPYPAPVSDVPATVMSGGRLYFTIESLAPPRANAWLPAASGIFSSSPRLQLAP